MLLQSTVLNILLREEEFILGAIYIPVYIVVIAIVGMVYASKLSERRDVFTIITLIALSANIVLISII